MKYSVLGFNQIKLLDIRKNKIIDDRQIEIKLDLSDLVLLKYIEYALASPSMQKIIRDEQSYVWLKRNKIIEDLPILNIQYSMVGKHLEKLQELNLIKTITLCNDKSQGSKTYYSLTKIYEDLIYEPDVKNYIRSNEPDVKNYISNNTINLNDNKEVLSKDNTMSETQPNSSFLGSAKHIIEINKDKEVDKFLELYKEHCTNFPSIRKLTPARRDGILALLKEYTWDDIIEAFDKANESDFLQGKCEGTWKADFDFFLRKDKFIKILEGKYSGKKKKRFENEGKCVVATPEEERRQEEWRKEMNKLGKQTVF